MAEPLSENATAQKPFSWPGRSKEAALLVAEDELLDAEIAAKVGVNERTLYRWKNFPEFQEQVTRHLEAIHARARRNGIARLDRRVRAANDRHKRMTALIEARAAEMAGEVAGGETGLLVRQLKHITVRFESTKDGKTARTPNVTREEHYEYAFDAALVRELREHEKHVAQDVGQSVEKVEITGANGGPIRVQAIDDRIDALAEKFGITREAVLERMAEARKRKDEDDDA